jgi:hypothetical protein
MFELSFTIHLILLVIHVIFLAKIFEGCLTAESFLF